MRRVSIILVDVGGGEGGSNVCDEVDFSDVESR